MSKHIISMIGCCNFLWHRATVQRVWFRRWYYDPAKLKWLQLFAVNWHFHSETRIVQSHKCSSFVRFHNTHHFKMEIKSFINISHLTSSKKMKGEAHIGSKKYFNSSELGYFRPRRIRIWGLLIPEPLVLFAKSKNMISTKIRIRGLVTHKNHQGR